MDLIKIGKQCRCFTVNGLFKLIMYNIKVDLRVPMNFVMITCVRETIITNVTVCRVILKYYVLINTFNLFDVNLRLQFRQYVFLLFALVCQMYIVPNDCGIPNAHHVHHNVLIM